MNLIPSKRDLWTINAILAGIAACGLFVAHSPLAALWAMMAGYNAAMVAVRS